MALVIVPKNLDDCDRHIRTQIRVIKENEQLYTKLPSWQRRQHSAYIKSLRRELNELIALRDRLGNPK